VAAPCSPRDGVLAGTEWRRWPAAQDIVRRHIEPMSWRPWTTRRKSWQPQFHHLKHTKPGPRWSEPRNYFLASAWPRLPKIYLNLAIKKLSTEEFVAKGAARARFRSKRLRAVEVFRRRFGEPAWLIDYSHRKGPL